ncbi:MAG: DEAD/DEAH box helicase, partial [Verrucomicrobiales bacterium]
MPLSPEQIANYLCDNAWRNLFDGGALADGSKLARARQVADTRAELLDTGDVEITSSVTERDSRQFRSTIALWLDGSTISLDATCTCDMANNCQHNVATLERLAKLERLQVAFGQTPEAQSMKGADKKLQLKNPPKTDSSHGAPEFVIRVERRPEGNERLDWLPEIYAHATVTYGGEHRVPLTPSGSVPPIVTPEGKIQRDRLAEMEALQLLYAIDLQPGAEEPPNSLRKLATPPQEGTLWAPDRKKWPHPEFYWQRFRQEATPALESRGWQVQFSAHVGLRPLVFRTETWSAQIVEEGRGWFNLSAGFEIDGERFELQPILASLVENQFLEATEGMPAGQEFMIFLPDGRGLALPVGRFRNILTTLGALLQFKFTEGPIRLSKLDAAAVAEDADLDPAAPDEVAQLAVCTADFRKIERVPVPEGLRADLRQYQLDGYHWMQFLSRFGLNGILADDMGLGKTLQAITHLLAEKETGRDHGLPSLVIAPTSVVENWQREAAKFAPGLEVLVLQGADRATRFDRIADADIALTSYALIHRDLETYLKQRFHLLILDEAQHIKNPGAIVSGAVRQLDASHRLCLSGTPVENHLGELWSLMDFLMPGLLGSAESFNEIYRTPIERNGSKSKGQALAERVGPLILRRTKHDVAKELPPKTEIVHSIELDDEQKDLYETVRATMDKKVRDALALQGTQSQIVFLDALMKL